MRELPRYNAASGATGRPHRQEATRSGAMHDKPQLEIPEPVRELAERNVEQVRSAYNQFMEMARQAQELVAKS